MALIDTYKRLLSKGIQTLGGMANSYVQGVAKPLANVSQQIGNTISNQVASAPFALSNLNKNIQMATRPMMIGSTDATNPIGNTINQRLPIKHDVLGGPGYTPNPEGFQLLAGQNQNNVDVNPYNNYPAPKSDTRLEMIKQDVLSSPNLRPAARNYQSNIPITYETLPKGVMGATRNQKGQNPYIVISDEFNQPVNQKLSPVQQSIQKARQQEQLNVVIEHELLHQTPRLVPTELFHPKNEPIINEYTQRWGKDYMKRPTALVEEMFAEEALPPAYYWHIFKRVNPEATQKDFISQIKSYFINRVNTPEPTNSNQGLPGTWVQPTYGRPTQ